jgi:hypothetical protein
MGTWNPVMRSFLYNLCLAVTLLALPGCGVVYSFVHHEDRLDTPLSLIMTKTDVEETLGKPAKVVRDNGQLLVWEYRLYPRYHWAKELLACPFTAWLGGCFIYPAIGVGDPNYPRPFYVVLYDDRLCVWGTLEVVSASTACQAPITTASQGRRNGT